MKILYFLTHSQVILSASLPGWAVVLYYLFFILTISMAIAAIFQKKVTVPLNIVTILLPFIMFIVSLATGIGRPYEYDEFQWLLVELSHFKLWAIFIVVSYAYLVFWWFKYITMR